MSAELNQYFDGAFINEDGKLELDVKPGGNIEWTPAGYRYSGRVLQQSRNEGNCVTIPEGASEICGVEGVNCCDNQVLRENANCELWAPPQGCVQSHEGSFTGAVSNLISPSISPGSTYEQETPTLCVPVPDRCYEVQSMAFICGAVSVRFVQPEDGLDGETPTFSVQGRILCADFPFEGQDAQVSEGFYWAWSEDIAPEVDNVHTYNIQGCCNTGRLEPGDAWKPKFRMEVSNGTGANTDIEIIGWRINFCMDMVSMPSCAELTDIEDDREFRSVQIN